MSATSPSLRRTLAPALVLLPMLVVTLFFFVIPMAAVLISSLSAGPRGDQVFTLGNYISILTDDFYWEVLWRTVKISLITTFFALLLGYPAALYVYFSESGWRRVMLLVVVSPLFISVIVRTYGWMVVFSPNGPLQAMMPEDTPLRLQNTLKAVVAGLVHIHIPFMILALNASLQKVDRRLISAATSLGASNLRTFRDVLLPLSFPGVQAGVALVFASTMTSFATPMLLGGSSNKTMAFMIYQQNLLLGNWNMGGAVAIVLLAATLGIVFFLNRLLYRRDLQEATA
jgi:putative spermidine/putrescine transport system permease protein